MTCDYYVVALPLTTLPSDSIHSTILNAAKHHLTSNYQSTNEEFLVMVVNQSKSTFRFLFSRTNRTEPGVKKSFDPSKRMDRLQSGRSVLRLNFFGGALLHVGLRFYQDKNS